MTNMLPRDRAELIMAEHAAGKSIREIAAAYGHSTQTVRDYVLGRRTPGEPAARDDDFVPFAA
jgi:predicted transcriptional regulator